jgi:WD40 repeat protein
MNLPTDSQLPLSEQTFVNDEHPWPGLASFREQDQQYFKGRDSDLEKMHMHVDRECLTVLFGVSGLGKSSLLQAGLFPRLRLEHILPIYIRLDFTDVALSLSEQVFLCIARDAQNKAIEVPLHTGKETLWEYFHCKDAEFWDDRNRLVTPLLCFDQFEEIFTLGCESQQRSNEVKHFISELADLIEGRCPEAVKARLDENPHEAKRFSFRQHPYKVILSLREDYLADLEGLRASMPSIIHNRMRLLPMNGDQAFAVANQTQGRIMDADVAKSIIRLVAGKQGEEYDALAELRVEPALLCLICRELNERRIANGARKIDAESVASNRDQILENFYERSLENQSVELRRFIEDRLITVHGFRNSEAYENALEIPSITSEAIYQLVQRRLLRLQERDGVKRIELIHDVLTSVVRKSRNHRLMLEKQRQVEAEREQAQESERKAQAALRASKRWSLVYLAMAILFFSFFVWIWTERNRIELAKLIANAEHNLSSDPQLSLLMALSATSQTSLELPAIHKGESVNRRFSEVKKFLGFDVNTDRNIALFAHTGRALALDAENVLHRAVQVSRIKYVFEPEARGQWSVAFSPNGQYMATSGDQNIVAVWELGHLNSWRKILSFKHQDVIRNVTFSSNSKYLAAASYDATATIWNIETRQNKIFKRKDFNDSDKIRTVAFSPDGLMLATGHEDGKVILWDATLDQNQEIKRFELDGHSKAVWSIRFNSNGAVLASASADKTAKIWDVKQGVLLRTFEGHTDTVSGIAFSPDDEMLATSSKDRTARIWHIAEHHEPFILVQHKSKVWNIAFSPNGHQLATTGGDGTTIVWELDRVKNNIFPLFTLIGHKGRGVGIAFSPDAEMLATASDDGTVRIWNVAASPEVLTLKGHQNSVGNVLYKPKGDQLITVSDDETIKFWDSHSGRELKNLIDHTLPIRDISLDFEGNRLAGASSNGAIIIWDISGDTVRQIQIIQDGKIRGAGVALSPDGAKVAAALHDYTVQLWDIKSGKILNIFVGHTGSVNDLVFSTDGKRLATVSDDRTIKLWDVDTAKKYIDFSHLHKAPIRGIAFDPAERLLVSVSVDGLGLIWDIQKGSKLYELNGHIGEIHGVDVSRDGQRIASAGEDGTVRIWNAASGKLELTLTEYPGVPLDVSFSPDGNRIAVSGINKTVEIFTLRTKELVALAIERLRHTNDAALLEKCTAYLTADFCESIQ